MYQESLCFQPHYQDATADSQGVLPQSPASPLQASPLHFISAVPAGQPSCPQGTCGKSYNYVGCHTEGRGALLRSSERAGMLLRPQQGKGKLPTTKNHPTQNVKSTQVPKPKFTGISSFNRQAILQGSNCCYPRSTSEPTGAPGSAQSPVHTSQPGQPALALTGQPPQALMRLRIQRKEALSLKQVYLTSWVYHQHYWVEMGLSARSRTSCSRPLAAPLCRELNLPSTRRHQGSVAKEIRKRKPQSCELWGKAGFSPTLTPRRPPLSLPPPISPSALGTQGHSCWALSLHTHTCPHCPGWEEGQSSRRGQEAERIRPAMLGRQAQVLRAKTGMG